ncbi:hypothetical protein AAG570_007020 [Ranatra chinensis]|uniref:Uncharacterized protein n=1 Tax=Ranatra chinensis TaxID=642074 RepID=A0ABD0YVS9_9HEMI
MASKRRNMFHKNKMQETTENDTSNLPPFCFFIYLMTLYFHFLSLQPGWLDDVVLCECEATMVVEATPMGGELESELESVAGGGVEADGAPLPRPHCNYGETRRAHPDGHEATAVCAGAEGREEKKSPLGAIDPATAAPLKVPPVVPGRHHRLGDCPTTQPIVRRALQDLAGPDHRRTTPSFPENNKVCDRVTDVLFLPIPPARRLTDLERAYYQIPVAPEGVQKTGVITPFEFFFVHAEELWAA